MKLWQSIFSRGFGSSLDVLANKLFTSLIKSQTFRNTVIETEKTIIKGIRYAGNPEKGARDFHRSEQEAVDYLAEKAKQAAAGGATKSAPRQNASPPPSNMTASGYQAESEWSRWYKTKKYGLGVAKQRWFR